MKNFLFLLFSLLTCSIVNAQNEMWYWINGRSYKITVDSLTLVAPSDSSHEYVDLGLPSGTLWATYNIGATKSIESGDFFAWGETAPKDNYSYSTYTWCEGSYDNFTKYCTNSTYGTVDSLTVLEATDDAATFIWGNNWRMPTKEELQELCDSCTWTLGKDYSSGTQYLCGKSKINKKEIYFPIVGYKQGKGLYGSNSYAYCWSSNNDDIYNNYAYVMKATTSGMTIENVNRSFGFCIRAVLNK